VLLIAGDIFDTVNPPVKAQERLYDFIVSAHEQQPLLTIVMIAGNHDSGSRIELPAPLMRRAPMPWAACCGWMTGNWTPNACCCHCRTPAAKSPAGAWRCRSCARRK
jgi:hypothetical protein